MKSTCNANNSTYTTLLCFDRNRIFLGSYLNAMYFFVLKLNELLGIRYVLSAPHANCFAFLDPIPLLKRIV